MEEQRGTTVDMTPDKREHSLNLIVLQDLIREQKLEIERLRAALSRHVCDCKSNCEWESDVICPDWEARLALEDK